MNKLQTGTYLILIYTYSLLLISCNCDNDHMSINIPETATNLSEMNSTYDDWNCGASYEHLDIGSSFLFSSNRNSQGQDFDLIPHNLIFDAYYNNFEMENATYRSWEEDYVKMTVLASTINNNLDQLGPTLLNFDGIEALIYSEGLYDQHDLKALIVIPGILADTNLITSIDSKSLISNLDKANIDILQAINPDATIVDLAPLNSLQDDGYLSYNSQTNRFYFHSNRSGSYRIYEATLPDNIEPVNWLKTPTSDITIREMTEISSDSNDRTPYVKNGKMFFVSDRSGSLGGFDIYYSEWSGGAWTTPVNLGPNINSSANEYRPVYIPGFEKGSAIIYSSNRTGGVGGYDLYLAKVTN